MSIEKQTQKYKMTERNNGRAKQEGRKGGRKEEKEEGRERRREERKGRGGDTQSYSLTMTGGKRDHSRIYPRGNKRNMRLPPLTGR